MQSVSSAGKRRASQVAWLLIGWKTQYVCSDWLEQDVLVLRWLETVSNTFEDLDFDGSL